MVDSRAKGARGETIVRDKLRELTGLQWERVPGSGALDPKHKLTSVLTEMLSKNDPDFAKKSDIKWNFTKFLVDKSGNVVARFEPTTSVEVIEQEIKKLI